MLLLLCLALAAAHPFLAAEHEPSANQKGSGPRRIAFVIDASLSMRARHGTYSSYELAKRRVERHINRLAAVDQAILVQSNTSPEVPSKELVSDKTLYLQLFQN